MVLLGKCNKPPYSTSVVVIRCGDYDEYHDISKYYVYSSGEISLDYGDGLWAKTLIGAKRLINMDTGLNSKDWTWQKVSDEQCDTKDKLNSLMHKFLWSDINLSE